MQSGGGGRFNKKCHSNIDDRSLAGGIIGRASPIGCAQSKQKESENGTENEEDGEQCSKFGSFIELLMVGVGEEGGQ